MFEICSTLATRTPEQRLVLVCLLLILEQISHIVLVLTLLTLKKQMLTELCDTWGGVSLSLMIAFYFHYLLVLE